MKTIKKKFLKNNIDSEYDHLFAELLQIAFPQGCLDLITYIVSELFTNIKEHSYAKKVHAELKINKSDFFLLVEDNGIGIRNSFLKNDIFAKNDRTAIQLAVGGLSAKKKNERAFGLYSIHSLAEQTGGKMILETGNSKSVFLKNKVEFISLKKKLKGLKVSIQMYLKKISIYNYIQ